MDKFGTFTSDVVLSETLNLMEEPEKDHYKKGSAWLITVNSNVAYQNIDQARNIVSNIRASTDIIFNNKNPESHFSEVWRVLSPLGDAKYKVRDTQEVGRKYHKIHTHVLVSWEHYGKIRLDYSLIRRLYKEYMCPSDGSRDCYGVTNPHISVKFMQKETEDYLSKGTPLKTAPIEGRKIPRLHYLSSTNNNNPAPALAKNNTEDLTEMMAAIKINGESYRPLRLIK
jgi:hypothetical protein